jgi:glutamate synthase domain-containing protein 1/glutamate synthase domain-containing protein 3
MQNKLEAEGGCGVIGVASEEKIAGRHLIQPLLQMRNRGNGKGGGIAAAGLDPSFFNISQEILDRDYLLVIYYLDPKVRSLVEKECIPFHIDHVYEFPRGVVAYFIQAPSDELVYQNSILLNNRFYAALGEKQAFVLSHAKNLLILKLVGYADEVIEHFQIGSLKAHVWIGHHRYPTKGKVWHPGGAHPFIGMHEALVHNGDFANYYSITEYLAERQIHPHFLTDTEVAVLLFDLWHRIYKYPLEYVIEALAPTTERDFTLLPEEKQKIYKMLQQIHIHGSPDGPWFFLIAQSLNSNYRLIGVTDTSMLRPQVFSIQQGIGCSASEKQAIDALLESLGKPEADLYLSARGGSYTDGGAFIFEISDGKLTCTNKFGQEVLFKSQKRAAKKIPTAKVVLDASQYPPDGPNSLAREIVRLYQAGDTDFVVHSCKGHRFIGNGLGPHSHSVKIEVFGSSGDYIASGIDGAHLIVHGSAQDQVAQIMKGGRLVVHGDVGQTFMYGAKGGAAFIRGNAAGRPLINAVGNPRVVINGTCLDYLGESFMAGDPLKNGGFVILNGLDTDFNDLETPYPGSNLFALPSGGAIYLRDPHHKVTPSQLNGGVFAEMTQEDWHLILPYLEENNRWFDLPIDKLLGAQEFHQVYRKIEPARFKAMQDEERWVKGYEL